MPSCRIFAKAGGAPISHITAIAPHRLTVPAAAAAIITALGLAAGCSVGPAYRRPDIAPPPAWRTATEPVQGAAAAGGSLAAAQGHTGPGAGTASSAASTAIPAPEAWPSADWWRGFESPELEGLLEEGRRANDDLAAAIARVRQADAEIRVSSAPLLPSLDAGAAGSRQRTVVALGNGGAQLYDQFTAQLTAAYQLDFWGRNRAVRAAAVAAAAASEYDRETVELSVMASIADTYFAVLELRDRLRIARDNLASAQSILEGLQTDESVGTTTALDVAQQETVVATLGAAVPPLEQQLRQATDALAILIGRTPQSFEVRAQGLADLAAPPLAPGLPSGLLARRPDVARAEAQLVAANADIRAARAAFLPAIELTASGGYESRALETLLEPGSRIFALSAGLTQPIFHGGAILGQYRLTQARYSELLAQYHKAVISAFGNVEDALAAVRGADRQLAREQNAADKARHAYELSQDQFHAGTVNILTVLNTETALFAAQDALAQVRLAQLQARIGLFNALGGGWQR